MKNKIIYLVVIAVLLLVGGGYLGANYFGATSSEVKEVGGENKHDFTVTVYKSPTCGCCSNYVSHLREDGFEVEVVELSYSELDTMKDEMGMPEELRSCHTAIWEDYVVEGHVPLEAVKKMGHGHLDAAGIGMAGMPDGSPGMPGTKIEPFEIYSFTSDGEMELFMSF